MNKAIFVAIAGLLIVSIPALSNTITPVYAQESVFAPVMNLSKTGQSNDPQIATSGNNVYVVWVGDDSENGEIFFTRSTDGGIIFSDPINISNASGLSTEPELAVYGNNVYVAWRDQALGRDNILFVRSTGAGTTFDDPVNLSKEIVSSGVTYISRHQIATYGNNVYVIWIVQASSRSDVFFARSSDTGASFSTPINLSKKIEGYAGFAQMTVLKNTIYIAWHKGIVVPGSPVNPDIYFTTSKNGGLTFSEPVILTNSDAVNSLPQIASSDYNIYLAWFHSTYRKDGTLNSSSILFTRSIDQGASFGNVTKIAENSRLELGIPRMVAFENNVYMIWRLIDEANNIYAVFFARSSDGGLTFSESINLNSISRGLPSFEIGTHPAIAVSGSDVYVVWSDITSEGNYEIFLVGSTDQGASFTDPINLSNSETSSIHPEIAISGNTAYVVWTDYLPKGTDVFLSKATVKNGSASEVKKPPVIISKVELGGPAYFVEGVDICGWGKGSLSDAFQWVEIRNTREESVKILHDWSITVTNGTQISFTEGLTLGPKESCLVQTADVISVRIGPGGSGGLGPPHGYDGSAVILKYSVETDSVIAAYKDSTPELSDTYGDTRSWQLIDGEWVFKNGVLTDADRTTLTEITEDGSVIVNLILAEEITAPTDSKFRVSFIDALTQQLMNKVNYQMIFEGTSMPINTSSVPLALVGKDNPFKREWNVNGFAGNGTDTQIHSISSPGSLNITIRILGINDEPLAQALNVKFTALATTGFPEHLQITEVELASHEGDQWIELYNPTNRPINASKLVLKQLGGEWATVFSRTPLETGFGKENFTMNSVTLQPHEYRVFEISSEDDSSEERFLTSRSILSLVINEREVSRTPELTDEDADSRTWQLEGKQWVFAEATPSRAIPEFPVNLILVTGVGLIGTLIASRFKGRILSKKL